MSEPMLEEPQAPEAPETAGSFETPDVAARMQEGRDLVDEGLRGFAVEALSRAEMEARRRGDVRAAQLASQDMTPQGIAESRALAEGLGLSPSIVAAAPDAARREFTVRRIAKDDLLAEWASRSAENATHAREWTDAMVDFFADAPNWGNRLMHWLAFDSGKVAMRNYYDLVEGASQLNSSLAGFGRMFAENVFGADSWAAVRLKELQDSLGRYKGLAGQHGVGVADGDTGARLWSEFVKSAPQQAFNIMAALATGGAAGAGAGAAGAMARAAPAFARGVMGAEGVGAVGALASQPAAAAAGMLGMGAQIAGGSYSELREKGVSPLTAGAAAMGNAMLQAPLERFGVESFIDIFRAKGMREALGKALASIFSEGGTEYLQKWPEYMAHTWAESEKHGRTPWDRANWFVASLFNPENLRQAHEEGLWEAAVGAMWGGLGGGVRIGYAMRSRQAAREFAADLRVMQGRVQQAVQQGIPPEVVSSMMQSAVPLAGDKAYVDAEGALTLHQEGVPVLDALGISEEELIRQADEGGAVPVTLADLMSQTDEATFAALSEHVSMRPGAQTSAEAGAPADAEPFTRSALAAARREASRIPGVGAEVSRIYRELQGLGLSRAQARDNATLLSVQALTAHKAYGQDPLAILKRKRFIPGENYRLQAGDLDQRGWHGSPHDTFESFDDLAIGTGEGHQIHGHGHYIAEDRGISDERYRKRLLARMGAKARLTVDGVEHAGIAGLAEDEFLGKDVRRALEALENGNAEVGRSFAEQLARQASDMDVWARAVEDTAAWIESGGNRSISQEKISRHMMELLPEDKRGDVLVGLGIDDLLTRAWSAAGRVPDAADANFRRSSDVARAVREDAAYLRRDADAMIAKSGSIQDIDWDRAAVERDKQGQLYEVEIPEEDEMLREDGSFEEQPGDVQEAMRRLAGKHGIELDGKTRGKDFYWALKGALGSARAASDALHAEGVKGISYWGGIDGHAWVVFKGADIGIVKTYFQGAGPAADAEIVGPPTLYQVQNLDEWADNMRAWQKANPQEKSKGQIEGLIRRVFGQMKIIDALETKDGIAVSEKIAAAVKGAKQAKKGRSKGGFPASGPVRTNSDDIYQISFDASSMCVKRLSAAKTAAEAQQRLGRPLTVDEQLALIALYRAEGKEAPCIYCYVESNRRRATQLVGEARDIIAGVKQIPESWKPDRRAKAEAAAREFQEAGLSREDVVADYVLDPAAGATEKALEAKARHPAIYEFMNFEAANTKQNKVKLYEEYVGNLLALSKEQVELLNGYAGIRFFSTSDFQIEHMVDLMQAFADMAAIGAKSHAYTKVPMYVDIFGKTGQKINMSCFAEEDPVTGEIRADVAQGWDWEEAKKRRAENPDCGTVLVASSDRVLRWAMEQDWIDYIIPFHYSGLGSEYYNTLGWQDFQAIQNEQAIKDLKREVKDRGAEAGRVRMHEITNPNKEDKVKGITDKQGTRRYLELCKNRGLYPVFTSFCFKQEVFADIEEKYAEKLSKAKDNSEKMKVLSSMRQDCEKRAKAMWKDMVEKNKIDWSKINEKAFKFKKDYARTDTAFKVVNPAKINMEMAAKPLADTIEAGLDAKYQADPGIVDKLVKLAQWSAAHGNAPIGAKALEASRAKIDPMSHIMGGEAYPTAYKTAQTKYDGVTLNQNAVDVENDLDLNDKEKISDFLDTVSYTKGKDQIKFKDIPESIDIKELSSESPKEWFEKAKNKIEPLVGVVLDDPLGNNIHFKNGDTETLDQYVSHLISGMDKGVEQAHLRRTMGVFLAEETVRHPLAVVRQPPRTAENSTAPTGEGRLVYLSMYTEGTTNYAHAIVVGVEVGQDGRIITSIVTADNKKDKKAALRQFKKMVNNADEILLLDRTGLSGHSGPATALGASQGNAPLHPGGKSNVADGREGVNDGERILNQGKQRVLLGTYTRTGSGEDLIRIFSGHNASTVPHEAAHAFIQGLIDIAEDDGSGPRRQCVDALVQAGMLEGVAKQYASLQAEHLSQVIVEIQGQLASGEQAVQEKGADKKLWAEDKKTLQAQLDALTQMQRHLVGQEQARADLRTLKEWAGVPAEGPLTEAQYVQFQEQAARGFEGYLATGKAPTSKLAGVFARMKQWLLAVYKNIRDYVGAEITPEVRAVYDRLLATEEEMQADEIVQTCLGAEQDAIAMLGCSASDAAYLEDMLTRAHMAACSRVDRERAKDRKKRFKAAYEMALTSLMDQPLWRLATGGYGRINYESLKDYLDAREANELRKRLPKTIVSGDGSTLDVIAMGFDDETLAREFGGNADDIAQMLYEHIVLNGETLKGEATALANQALEQQDAGYSVEDGFLAGDEYGEFLDALEDAAAKIQRRDSRKGKARAESKAERASRLQAVAAERRARWAEYQRRAREELDAAPVGQIDPRRYAAMLRKALKGKDSAILSRDPDRAVQAVRQARYAFALMQEARRRRDMVEKNLAMVLRLCRRKEGSIAPVPATALARLLGNYGFRTPQRWGADPDHEGDSMQALVDYCVAESQGEATAEVTPVFAEWLLAGGMPEYAQNASWQALTWADYNDLMDMLNFFAHASREQNQASRESMKARVNGVVEHAVLSMSGLRDMESAARGTWRRRLQDAGRKIFGAVQALQWQFRKADGFQNAGPRGHAGEVEDQCMRPILEAEGKWKALMKDLSGRLLPHLEALRRTSERLEREYGKGGTLRILDAEGRPVSLPEALRNSEGRSSWTTDQIIAGMLNMGNAGNRQRMTGGYPDLSYGTLAAIYGSDLARQVMVDGGFEVEDGLPYQPGILTAEDWAAVQGVWDAIETLWEPTVAVHRSMYGFAPRRVDVEPMEFRAGGLQVSMRGGYYPVYYDKDISLRAQSWGEKDDILATTESFFAAPSARRGHTKSRQKKTSLPLRLSTSTLMEHVQDATRLICFAEPVRFADRVTQNHSFQAEYVRHFGQEDYLAIRPNLKGIVRSEPAPKDALIKLANACRKYLVSAGLWGNLKVAVLQTTALGPAMGDLGALPVWQAMGRIATGGWSMIREIQQASPYMMSRWRAFDQDLLDRTQSLDVHKRPRSVKIGSREISWDDVVNAGMTPLCLVDLVTSGAIWSAAYSKAMKEFGVKGASGIQEESEFHERAVQLADEAVKKSNPDFDASSRSAFLRAQNSYRLINAFGSAVTLMAQRGEYMMQAMRNKRISKTEFARWEAYEMFAPAVAMTLVLALVRGIAGGDDGDGKELLALFFESLLDQYSMKLPIVGSLLEDTVKAASGLSTGGRQPTMRTSLDTVFGLPYTLMTSASRVAQDPHDSEARKKLSYAIGDVVSFVARVPVSKLVRNAERGYDQWQRGEGTPASMLMPAPGK